MNDMNDDLCSYVCQFCDQTKTECTCEEDFADVIKCRFCDSTFQEQEEYDEHLYFKHLDEIDVEVK